MPLNTDLANAKNIIILAGKNETAEKQIAQDMVIKSELLEAKKYDLNEEKKLELLVYIINLTIYNHHQKSHESINGKNLSECWSKLREYYNMLCTFDITLLNFTQKAKWASLIGSVYEQTEHYEAAISFYRDAIDYTKSSNDMSLIQSYRVNLILIYIKLGHKYTYDYYAPLSATERYKTALQLIDESPNVKSAKLFYLKAQTLAFMADLAEKQKDPKTLVRQLLFRALYANCEGLKITPHHSANIEKYIKHMQGCCGKILSSYQSSEKENKDLPEIEIKKLSSILTTYNKDRLENVCNILTKIESMFKPKTVFWQLPGDSSKKKVKNEDSFIRQPETINSSDSKDINNCEK